MRTYDNSVQLFYLGTLYLYGLPGLFGDRFFLSEPDQNVLMLGGVQPTNRADSPSTR